MYDAIIIGAGLGSLTAAAKLSLNAKKILLIEKNSHIGGAAGSFKVNNFNFDVSLHNFGPYNENTKLYTIFKELGIDKKLNFIPFKSYQKIIFPDIELDMEKGFSNFTDYLINIFPDEAKGIKKIIKIAGKIFSEFNEFQNSKIGIDEIESREPAFPMLYPNITFLSHKTLEDFLSDHIKDKKLKGILGNLWWLFGIPPDELSAVLYLSPFFFCI